MPSDDAEIAMSVSSTAETAGEPNDVLVTGATGATGSCLAIELARQGHRVRAFVRSPARAEQLVEAGITIVEGDIRDADAVSNAAAGVQLIYHTAAVFRSAGHPDSYYRDVNAGGVENVIAAARQHGVARTVHCSTVGVHGHVHDFPGDEESPFNPGDIYQETKLEGEQIARAAFDSDVPGVVVRPAGIYGPGDLRFLKLFRTIHRKRFAMFGSGETLYHFTYIYDLVNGIILCGEHPDAVGGTYILGGNGYATLNETVRLAAAAVGVSAPRNHFPIWPLMTAAVLCQAVCVPFRVEPPLHKRRVEFFIKNRAFSCEKAKRELGYSPEISLAEGFRRTAYWYFEQGLLEGDKPAGLRRGETRG
jgi:dihydroflavonol-4-reductase